MLDQTLAARTNFNTVPHFVASTALLSRSIDLRIHLKIINIILKSIMSCFGKIGNI